MHEPAPMRADVSDLSDMRVALFTDTYAPQLNGVCRTLARLTSTLRDRGASVQVVTTTDPGARGAAQPALDRWRSVPFWLYPELRFAWPRTRRARRVVRSLSPTVVHVATPFGVGYAGRRAALASRTPLVTSYHTSFSAYTSFYGVGSLATPAWKYLRWFHNAGARTFVPTRAIGTELEEHGFERLAIWGRGVDAERFSPRHRSDAVRASWGARPEDIVVAYIGRVAREKGIDVAFDGIRHARQLLAADATQDTPAVRSVVVGDGPYLADARRKAPPMTHFAGRLEGAALAAAFASADVFVFPSTTDTFGNVLLEAMASGVPVLAVDVPPTRELLGGGTRGALVPDDARAFGDRLASLIRARDQRIAYAVRGRAMAEAQSWRVVFDELFSAYRAVSAP